MRVLSVVLWFVVVHGSLVGCGDDGAPPARDAGPADATMIPADAPMNMDAPTVDGGRDARSDGARPDVVRRDGEPSDSSAADDAGIGRDVLLEALGRELCQPIAAARCLALASCDCPPAARPPDDAACIALHRTDCESLVAEDLSFDDRDLVIVLDAVHECAAAIASYLGACRDIPDVPACSRALAEDVPRGGACQYGACAAGEGECFDGICVELPDVGQPCQELCRPGAYCDVGGCLAVEGAGGACEFDELCAAPLVCRAGTCASAEVSGGSACQSDGQCGEGTFCGGEAFDLCLARAALDAPCEDDFGCVDEAFCDFGSSGIVGTCRARPGLGEPCGELAECAAGLGCFDALCAPLPGVGARCTDDLRCDAGLGCDARPMEATVCVPRRGVGPECVNDDVCDPDAYCRSETSQCTARVGVGGPCPEGSECSDGAICDFPPGSDEAICQPAPGLGEPCTTFGRDACRDGAFCGYVVPGGACVPYVCDSTGLV